MRPNEGAGRSAATDRESAEGTDSTFIVASGLRLGNPRRWYSAHRIASQALQGVRT